MFNARKRIALLAATTALTGGLALAAPAQAANTPAASRSASAISCSGWKTIHVNHNAAGEQYMECDRTVNGHKQTSAALYLWDNKADGKCAETYLAAGFSHWNGLNKTWDHWYSWCSTTHHSPKIQTGWHSGNDVEVSLQLR
ncbi:hypothetical protein ACH40F_51825 [Streptomyces sp. NPDC020794]|uniref:hypothetical protein n=1 Tax=unclassified Streptomyces TaxID=2593676 RepID=UPI0036E9545E